MKFQLESKNLILRVLNYDSAGLVHAFYKKNYEYLSKWEPNLSRQFLAIETIEKILEYEFKSTLNGKFIRYWFAFKSSPDKLLGSVNFQDIKKGAFKSCHIGYKIDEAFAGLGLTSEAVATSIKAMQEDEGIRRIEAIICQNNTPSIKLAEKLGFVNEGISREYAFINEAWQDCFRYSLLKGELKT